MALNRTEAASLVTLAASVVFWVACGGSDALEERWAALEVPEAEVVFLGDWTDEERAAIAREVKSVQVSFAVRFGEVTSEFTLYISTDFDALNDAYEEWLAPEWRRRGVELPSWFSCHGFAWPEALFISLETCEEDGRRHGGEIIAHEYFHMLQRSVGLTGGTGDTWPSWLREGAAEYASAHYEEEQGRSTLSYRRKVAHAEWSALGFCFPGLCNRARGDLTPDLTGYADVVLHYEVGFLAVDWLVERKGEQALMEFFRLGGGRHEFEEAFGVTTEEFGEGMEELWREVAPPFEWQISGNVVEPEGRPISYVEVDIVTEVEDERIVVMGGRADVQGEFRVYGPAERHTLGVFLKCPDGSRIDWAFAGEWGGKGFVADEDGRFKSDDEGAEPVAGGRNRTGVLIELPETKRELLKRHCGS